MLMFSFLSGSCKVPLEIEKFVKKVSFSSLKQYPDIKRNFHLLQNLCVNIIEFQEGKYHWKMLLVTNPKKSLGAFWFLPHDDEDTAFDSAVYATVKYGGGFLAIMASDKRYFNGQDPNRNFGETKNIARICKQQFTKAPKYSHIIFSIINAYRDKHYPYLALHNNKNGHRNNGGTGGVSILKSSSIVKSYPAHKGITRKDKGLRDEDTLVYIAGLSKTPNRNKLTNLLKNGLNTKYEIIRASYNDCSLSNYIVLSKKTSNYYNLETEHQDLKTQKLMIDKIMELLK